MEHYEMNDFFSWKYLIVWVDIRTRWVS